MATKKVNVELKLFLVAVDDSQSRELQTEIPKMTKGPIVKHADTIRLITFKTFSQITLAF